MVIEEFCIVHHDSKMCFLCNCRCHFFITGDLEELLQNRDSFFFKNKHSSATTFLVAKRLVARGGQVFYNVQSPICCNQRTKDNHGWKQNIADKVKKHCMISCQETSSMQTIESVIAEWNEQFQKTKFEIIPEKTVEYFWDVYRQKSSFKKSFKIKS